MHCIIGGAVEVRPAGRSDKGGLFKGVSVYIAARINSVRGPLPQNKRRFRRKRLFSFSDRDARARVKSLRVVHVEFDRMRGHFEALDFRHLQLDEAVDEVVVEHAAVLEERAILVEIFQGLAE